MQKMQKPKKPKKSKKSSWLFAVVVAASLVVAGVVLGAGFGVPTARASVWDRALTSPEDEAAKDLYDAKMLEGDTATLSATIQSASIATTLESIRRAEAAYRAAAALRPHDGEPYFRIGHLLYQMYFACEPTLRLLTCERMYATPTQEARVVEAWNEFEDRAPLDPRLGEILRKRALLNTKLVNGTTNDRVHLEAAARDYHAALDRSDGLVAVDIRDDLLLGNLAEVYMMLGRLDDAVMTYLRAVAVGAARVSTMYGLAVALDRNGAGAQAIRRILEQGEGGLNDFKKDVTLGQVFFVPQGEVYYYLALSHEAFGHHGIALQYWNDYVRSGANPEFQPRAREHIEQLLKKHVRAEPLLELDDRTWRRHVR